MANRNQGCNQQGQQNRRDNNPIVQVRVDSSSNNSNNDLAIKAREIVKIKVLKWKRTCNPANSVNAKADKANKIRATKVETAKC